MNTLFDRIKIWTRLFLLRIARDIKTSINKDRSLRKSDNLFSKEIKIPVIFSLIPTIVIVYCMLIVDLGINYKTMISTAIFIIVSLVFFILQVQNKEKKIFEDNDAVVLVCLLFIIAILMLQISKEYVSAFLSPVAAFAFMTAILLSSKIGVLYAICLSLFAAFLNDMRFDVFLVMFCGSIVVVSNVKNIRKRADFINIGIKIAIANTTLTTMFYFFDFYKGMVQFRYNLFYGMLNGAFAIVILLVFIPLFEKVFSRTTNIKLIELSDFNNPLLKKLMLEAPGTYHHSIMTADIAEQAANVINENSLLARVGAYYHDIGKLKNPEYFIENQVTGRNPHDSLTPTMSRLILISHVKDGIVLARQNNIDNEIINIIEQHHGTTPMHVFYHRALEEGGDDDINIENFRYPGPKPTAKITAVVMMADSCEAACRSIEEPTATRIKNMVEKIINNKFIDGQFSECPITLKDLDAIRYSIISTIIGIYHARIEYE
ncbi:MAG: HDIG domain-containing protein [Endomicrobium sp.]|nr:HDIG domain-containing protein [Endomicrobium sp.]